MGRGDNVTMNAIDFFCGGGGMRASIYNAMPTEGVIALVEFMKKFEAENA